MQICSGKRWHISIAFSDNCGYSLVLYQNSTSGSFLKAVPIWNLKPYQWTFPTLIYSSPLVCLTFPMDRSPHSLIETARMFSNPAVVSSNLCPKRLWAASSLGEHLAVLISTPLTIQHPTHLFPSQPLASLPVAYTSSFSYHECSPRRPSHRSSRRWSSARGVGRVLGRETKGKECSEWAWKPIHKTHIRGGAKQISSPESPGSQR